MLAVGRRRARIRSGRVAYLLWFAVVFIAGLELAIESRRVRPEIRMRARRLGALQKVIVAARSTARAGAPSAPALLDALLTHGMRTEVLSEQRDAAGGPSLRVAVRLGPKEDGELWIRGGARGRRIVAAAAGDGASRIELRALLVPLGGL